MKKNLSNIKFKESKLVLVIGIIVSLVLFFNNCKRTSSKTNLEDRSSVIKIKGSESEYNLIQFFTSEYKKENSEAFIEVAGGGSSVGIEALINGQIDIANSSRRVYEEEFQLGEKKGVILVPVIIALDAVAIITNSRTGIDSLSLNQLAEIFSGRISNWKNVGGEDMPIKIYGRNTSSGTYKYLLERLAIEKYSDHIVVKANNMDIINTVKNEKGSIAYTSLGAIMDEFGKPNKDIWAINIYFDGGKSHSPYELDAVKAGEYPLIRSLYQYSNGNPRGRVLDFIQFELSEKQQNKLESHGYFPIMPIHKTINQKNQIL